MDLTKKTVHYTQEGKTVFDRFYLDEDYNVPEQKEAVQRIVYSSAKLKTEDVRPVENYVKVTGKAFSDRPLFFFHPSFILRSTLLLPLSPQIHNRLLSRTHICCRSVSASPSSAAEARFFSPHHNRWE